MLLCEVKDTESLASMIEKLILDKDLRNSMGKEGRKLAEQEFDINKVVEKHFDIYELLISGFVGSYFIKKYKDKYDIKTFSFLKDDINSLDYSDIDVVFHLWFIK